MRKYAFLDFDGTIRRPSYTGEAPKKLDEIQVYPWASKMIETLFNEGFFVVGTSNQHKLFSTIGKFEVEELFNKTFNLIGIKFPYFYSTNEMEAKPSIGLIQKVEFAYGPTNKEESIVIGDDFKKDMGMAKNYDIKFLYVVDWLTYGTQSAKKIV